MKKITIKAGQPYSKPRFGLFKIDPQSVEIDFMLTDESTYYAEEDDWYKLGGISFSLIPNKNAYMFGIRKVETGWQMLPYINTDYEKNFKFDALYLEKKVPYKAVIFKHENLIVFEVYGVSELKYQWFYDCDKWGWIGFLRHFYAGGDSFPLNTFSLFYNIKIN